MGRSSNGRASHRLEQLNEIATLLVRFATVEETFDAALTVAAQVLPLVSAILVEDQPGGRTHTTWAPGGGRPGPAAMAHAEAALSYLMGAAPDDHARTPLAGLTAAPEWTIGEGREASQFIVLPLVVAGRPVFGALLMEATAFDKQDLSFVNAIANQFAVALDRDRAWRRDITRREHAEAMEVTLRAQTDALVASDRQRSEFLTALADELRLSLASSREVQQVLQSSVGGKRLEGAISTVGGQIRQMAQLIDDLRGLSMLTREQVQLHKARVEVGAIVARAAKLGSDRLSTRGQALTVSPLPHPAWLEADAVRLEQVIDVLIDKASLLVSPGGRIWLTSRVVAGGNGDPALPGGWAGPQLVVCLRDDGAGVVKSILPRVFDLLNPAGRHIDPTDASFGAGLRLMHRVVELHGGTVCATSSGLGLGSEFELRLPVDVQFEELRPERRSS